MTTELLRDLAGRFARLHVLVVGDLILDEYVFGDCTRLSPEAPIPVLRVRGARSVPGGAANTAANVATLGAIGTLIGVTGRDDAGRTIETLLAQHGVRTDLVGDERPTARKVRALGGQQQLLRLDYEDESPLPDVVVSATFEKIEQHIARTSIVVVSDYAKGLVTKSFCDALFALAARRGVPVVVDPRPQHADCYYKCDFLTPNWSEGLALAGMPAAQFPNDVDDVGRRIVGRFGANVLLTLGAHGLKYFGRNDGLELHEPAQAREVFDVSGAGDTVVAAFALAMAAGVDVRTALRLANRAASVVVAKVGTATVSTAELFGPADAGRRTIEAVALPALIRDLRGAGRRIVVLTGGATAIERGGMSRLREARGADAAVTVALVEGRAPDASEQVELLIGLRDVDYVCVVDDVRAVAHGIGPDIRLDESVSDVAGEA